MDKQVIFYEMHDFLTSVTKFTFFIFFLIYIFLFFFFFLADSLTYIIIE